MFLYVIAILIILQVKDAIIHGNKGLVAVDPGTKNYFVWQNKDNSGDTGPINEINHKNLSAATFSHRRTKFESGEVQFKARRIEGLNWIKNLPKLKVV